VRAGGKNTNQGESKPMYIKLLIHNTKCGNTQPRLSRISVRTTKRQATAHVCCAASITHVRSHMCACEPFGTHRTRPTFCGRGERGGGWREAQGGKYCMSKRGLSLSPTQGKKGKRAIRIDRQLLVRCSKPWEVQRMSCLCSW